MAERRMVSKVISYSEKVNGMNNFAKLLYTWMIPHADDWGRLPGSPAKLRVMVMPYAEEKPAEFASALADMVHAGLIKWYEVAGEKYVQIEKFEEHQQGLHKRTKSKFPEPPDDHEDFREFPGNSENIPKVPSELNRIEQNRTEGNGTEENGNESEQNARELDIELIKERLRNLAITLKLKNVGIYGLELIYSYIGQVDVEVIETAMKKAEGRHVNYFVSVINGYIEEGKTTKESIDPKAGAYRETNRKSTESGSDPPEGGSHEGYFDQYQGVIIKL